MKFIKLSLALLLSLNIGVAAANCVGTANSYNCYDGRSGNSYNVQTYGNSSYMQGYNAGTGSTWSQQSNTYGNSTYMNGTSSSGSSSGSSSSGSSPSSGSSSSGSSPSSGGSSSGGSGYSY
jgi:hypothetical protein